MAEAARRTGDKVSIGGDYQYNAVYKGNTFQRNWHILKLQTAALLAGTTTADSILDMGCGSGILIPFLNNNYQSYQGLDANEAAINFAGNTFASSINNFSLFQLDNLYQLEAGKHSHIFFLETIEHITAEQGLETLQQFYRLLPAGGICVLSTPNKNSLWPAIEWGLDFLKLTPPIKGEQHEKLYGVTELANLCIQAGFTVKDVETINGIAPWLSFLGKKTTQKIHGWESKQDWLPGSLIVMALQK